METDGQQTVSAMPKRGQDPEQLSDGHELLCSGKLSAYVGPLLLALVFFGGIGMRNYGEVYPIASWTMFSNVPSQFSMYTLLVIELDGKQLNPPALLMDVPELAKPFQTLSAYWLMRDFVRAVGEASKGKPGAHETQARLRQRVEKLFGKHKVVYELLLLNCNPLDLIRHGTAHHATGYGRFTTGLPKTQEEFMRRQPEPYLPGGAAP